MTHHSDPHGGVVTGSLRRLNPRSLSGLVSTLSFWAAIVLPVLYLPLLAAGIDSASGLAVFLGLFALHVLALVGGREHAAGR